MTPHEQPARRGRPPAGGREAALAATLDLLRERGAARLTTKEVAARAGVSEGSVFYHFGDRSGLLTAAFEAQLGSLRPVQVDDESPGPRATLGAFAEGVAGFLEGAMTAMIAAQADVDLRRTMIDYLAGRDLGPHRGVQAITDYLREQQAAGVVRADVDPEPVAAMLIGVVFMRAATDHLLGDGYAEGLPAQADVLDALATLLAPPPAGDA